MEQLEELLQDWQLSDNLSVLNFHATLAASLAGIRSAHLLGLPPWGAANAASGISIPGMELGFRLYVDSEAPLQFASLSRGGTQAALLSAAVGPVAGIA